MNGDESNALPGRCGFLLTTQNDLQGSGSVAEKAIREQGCEARSVAETTGRRRLVMKRMVKMVGSCQPQKTAWRDTQKGRKPMNTMNETSKKSVNLVKSVSDTPKEYKKRERHALVNTDLGEILITVWKNRKGALVAKATANKVTIMLAKVFIFNMNEEVNHD
jgi:hypothetical protein